MVQSNKNGLLELYTPNSGWVWYSFVLDDSTHSLCYYIPDAMSSQTTAVETIFLQHIEGVAAIPVDTICDEHSKEVAEEGAKALPLRLYQFRIEIMDNKARVRIWCWCE